jgi:antitoxin component YwqK of YwqJK toxin-antitoxin module
LQSECNYKVIKRENVKGQSHVKSGSVPHGTWIFYDQNGMEISRANYKNGIKQ